MKIFFLKVTHFIKIISRLIISPSFITVSLIGNFIVFSFAFFLFKLESGINPHIGNFMDALWWSFATTTSVGYGDVVPVTLAGKILGIFLMLSGVSIFSIYTALFAKTILSDDIYMS